MLPFFVVILSALAACGPGGREGQEGQATSGLPVTAGQTSYLNHCSACHQEDGSGVKGVFPPLAGSDYLEAPVAETVVEVILNGRSGPIEVNGVTYNSVMPNLAYLDDQVIADIASFVATSWGNTGTKLAVEDVGAIRNKD